MAQKGRQKRNDRLRVAAYIRVSDPSQVEGLSLDAQLAEIQQWCERHEYELVRVYRENGVTARSERIEKRPQLVALLKGASNHEFEIVAVHMIDRWSRNIVVQAQALQQLGAAGVGFASVTQDGINFTTSTGKLLLNLMGVLAEYYSDQLGDHVQKSQRQRVRLGLPVGPIGFGYKTYEPGRVPAPVPLEAEALQEAFRRRAEGEAYSHAAERLSDQGFRTREGNRFTAHAMKDIFSNKLYIGILTYRGDEYQGKHEPIIDQDLFQRVQMRRGRRTFQRKSRGDHGVAQGRAFCVRCGNSLQSDRHRNGKPMYRERHAHDCETNGRSLVAPAVDDQIALVFEALQLPADWRDRIAGLASESRSATDITRLVLKRKRLVKAYLDDRDVEEDDYRRRLAEIDAQLEAAQPICEPTAEEASQLLSDLPALWTEATNDERRRLVGPLIDRFYVDLDTRSLAAITPAPGFRWLLEGALQSTRHAACLVVSPEQAAERWSWWRRGRVELPVQRRASVRSYRRIRRLVLVRRASAGPASPDRADRS